ncbi:MAG TPA: ATP-dependent RNA helicase HrpA [Steroidobacteraceae bacterium]|nr:ATP-dependent RNA helicase HrpA [Steroidobacteraceae bacterium]
MAPDRMTTLKLTYDPALPITAHRAEILAALDRHPVIVVCGATGSGKSTQLPKLCLKAGRGTRGLIGHTQPRRIAARALASRIASELGATVGGAVGYQVRFTDRTSRHSRLKLMTDGILLRELDGDRDLRRYDTLIIDEAHERSLNIDLLLGVLRQILARRDDLRVIVTSATIDPERFSRFFGGAPVIEVSGRSYPVEVRYRPLVPEDEDGVEASLPEGIVAAVRELDADVRGMRGDVLAFLPGEKQIREAAEVLRKAALPGTEILPLYARLSTPEQERIFAAHSERRVVLATNVAETSLTVPGIRFVVDSGLARISRYSVRAKVQRLPIEPISQASAEQRKGRCGREAEGICIRLYSEDDFAQREAFTPPEVLRTNLASVILQMAARGLGDPADFPFLDAPDTRLVNDGVRLLQELQAMDEERRITPLGRKLAALPLDPRLGRMLLAAARHHCVAEMLIIAAFLAAQDPRERPANAQKLADEKHAQLADRRSDFVSVLRLWRAFRGESEALSGNQLRKWCREHFVSFIRMREWQDLHGQLIEATEELRLPRNRTPASYAQLHRAILSGFLGSIGRQEDRREYLGARGMRFVIAPGTPLASRPPHWVVAASLIETTRLFARMVAAVEPKWIETAAAHLVRRTYSEARWLEARGYVAALETVTLFGITLASQRRVNYGPIAPAEAREIFVREALAEGRVNLDAPFLSANRALRAQVEQLEAKIRRRDVLVDEQAQVDFYLARIPQGTSTLAAFERWRRDAERLNPLVLHMSPSDLVRREVPDDTIEQFPDELIVGASRLPLEYRFEPGTADDGVTLLVPDALLDALNADQLAWLVPGLRLEKITAVLRALPKGLRRELVPVPDSAQQALEESWHATAGFHQWMAPWITQRAGAAVAAEELAALPLPDHLRLSVRVLDAHDRVIAAGRDLGALKRHVHVLASTAPASAAAGSSAEEPLHRAWDFGELPESREIIRNRLRVVTYPAIEDRGGGIALIEARSAAAAESASRAGIARLAMLALPQQGKYVRARLAENRELVLLSQPAGLATPVADALTERAFRECFAPEGRPLPRTAAEFSATLDAHRGSLADTAEALSTLVLEVLREWRSVRAALGELTSPVFAAAVGDISAQIGGLLRPDLLESTPRAWLDELPRYFRAISRRVERLRGNVQRDAELARRARPFADALADLLRRPAVPAARAAAEQLRWMLEEYRVSLHAQELRTAVRVSEQRLTEQLARARAALSA